MTISEVVAGATQLSTLAVDAASVSDPGMTASRVTDLAVKLIPCIAADVVQVTAVGDLRVIASSDAGLNQRCRIERPDHDRVATMAALSVVRGGTGVAPVREPRPSLPRGTPVGLRHCFRADVPSADQRH